MKPDICAPGVSVRTSSGRSADELYEIFTGTSGASPHVAGAVALLWSAVPSLAGDVDRTEQVLEATARPSAIGRSPAAGSPAPPCPTRCSAGDGSTSRRPSRSCRSAACRRRLRARVPEPASFRPAPDGPGFPEIRSRPYADSVHQRRVPHPHGPRDRDPGRGGREGLRGRHAAPTPARPRSRASARARRPRASSPSGSPTRSRATSSSTCCRTRSPRRSRRSKLAILGRPHVDDLTWEPPGPIRFLARLDLKPSVDPGEYRGVPVEDQPVEPTEEEVAKVIDRIREAHAEFHPIEGRAAAPGRLRRRRHRRLLRRDPGARPESADLPRREDHARGRTPRLDARDQRRPAGRRSRRDTRSFRKTFADDFPNDEFRGKTVDYQVTLAALKEKKLPAARRRVRAGGLRGGHGRDAAREGPGAPAPREGEPTAGASSAGRSSTTSLAPTDVPAPEVLVESETTAALRDYARYLAASGVDPEKEDWKKLQDGGASGRRAPRPGVPAARRDRRAGEDRGLRDGARGGVQAGGRGAGCRAGGAAGADDQGRAASKRCATRCAWPGSSTS